MASVQELKIDKEGYIRDWRPTSLGRAARACFNDRM